MTKSPITTHVLNTALGLPAEGVAATLYKQQSPDSFSEVGSGKTNSDGRITDLLDSLLESGEYRITFNTGAYFDEQDVPTFYPSVSIDFTVTDPEEHYHVPLLLNPFGYSTYRGS